jgi:hypothetical protein
MEACHHKASIAMLGTIISWKPMFMFLMKNCTLLLVLKQCCNRLLVATLALGSWPKQRGYKVAGQKEGSPGIKAKALQGFGPRGSRGVTSHIPGSKRKCEGVNSHSQGNSHFGKWNPDGLSKLQRAIWGVKTQWLMTFFISSESSWNINV